MHRNNAAECRKSDRPNRPDKAKRSALVGSDREVATCPAEMQFGTSRRRHECVKRATILLRFDWLSGLIGALLW